MLTVACMFFSLPAVYVCMSAHGLQYEVRVGQGKRRNPPQLIMNKHGHSFIYLKWDWSKEKTAVM